MVRPKAYKRLPGAFSFRRGQPRSTLAADASAEEDPLFTLGLTWVHRASRPASGLLLYQLTTLRPATISGAAAGAHGKVPFGADAGASSALPILVMLHDRGGEGVNVFTFT